MAYIVYNNGEKGMLNTFLGGFAAGTTYMVPADPGAGSNFGVGLGTRGGGVGSNKADTIQQIGEIGWGTGATPLPAGTPSGYVRAKIVRNAGTVGSGSTPAWPAAASGGSNYQVTGPQVQFQFSGAPVANGATLWFVSRSDTGGQDDVLFGADLAATRTFANGDTEKIIVVFRAT